MNRLNKLKDQSTKNNVSKKLNETLKTSDTWQPAEKTSPDRNNYDEYSKRGKGSKQTTR